MLESYANVLHCRFSFKLTILKNQSKYFYECELEFIQWTMFTTMQAELIVRHSRFITATRRHNNEIRAVYDDETRTCMRHIVNLNLDKRTTGPLCIYDLETRAHTASLKPSRLSQEA